MLNGENELDNIGTSKKSLTKLREEIKSLTGIVMTDKAIMYLEEKFPREMYDITNYENEIGTILEEYDNFQLSNITVAQKDHQREMERFATEGESNLEGYTRYYKLGDYYFEWNEDHRKEHKERENKIEEVADAIVNRLETVMVDTRKPYGEVRYILTCKCIDRKQMVITCYRYDKTHIRIITAWKE